MNQFGIKNSLFKFASVSFIAFAAILVAIPAQAQTAPTDPTAPTDGSGPTDPTDPTAPTVPGGEIIVIPDTDPPTVSVPEASSILGVLAVGAFGAGSLLKRKRAH